MDVCTRVQPARRAFGRAHERRGQAGPPGPSLRSTGAAAPAASRPRHPRRRGAGAQPARRHGAHPARRARRHHGPVREREVEPRLRHALRRGAAPLRREPVGLRAPVPRPDGQARRGPHRRALAGDLHRPEDHQPQPAVDGGDRHRGLRLPAPALRPRGPAPLPDLRPADHGAERRADRRPDPDPARGDPLPGARAAGARPQGRAPRRARAGPGRGLHAGRRRRPGVHARRGAGPRPQPPAHHRGGRRPAGHARGPAPAPDRQPGDGDHALRRPRADRGGPARPRRRGALVDLLRALRLPDPRRRDGRARAAHLLVQLAPRRLPAVHRPRLHARDRPRADRRRRAQPGRGRGAALDRPDDGLLRPADATRSPSSTRSTSTGRGAACPSASASCCWRAPSGASACTWGGAARAAAGAGSRA